MSNRKLEIACITLYVSPGHKTILWVKNLVTKNRRVYPSLESNRTISLNRMLVYCRLWWPPLGVSQDFFTLSDHHFSLEWKDALCTGMGESYWALLHERLKGNGQSSISAIYVLIAKIFDSCSFHWSTAIVIRANACHFNQESSIIRLPLSFTESILYSCMINSDW